MKRITDIEKLSEKCTGCMACVDACPSKCITSQVAQDGFTYSVLDSEKCVDCGKCYSVCPIENSNKNMSEQHLFAVYAKNVGIRNRGSSGGVFEMLARTLLEEGYCVCGAAFDELVLKHRIVDNDKELLSLLKSKYIQSDMKGIYTSIRSLLKEGKKVFYCGTPCQVSALVNSVSDALKQNLFTCDIICHGVPSQTIFDMYISSIEKKTKCKIRDFSFRVKNNRYKHAHGYSYTAEKNGRSKVVNGIYSDSTFYNAFKQYSIFRQSCYDCKYTTLNRVSDITLGDFWGIEKYDFNGNSDEGVSMVITNSETGNNLFSKIAKEIVCKEFPIEYGVDSNHCLTHTTVKPKNRDAVIEEIMKNGYEAAAKKYFKCSVKQKILWLIPPKMRNIFRKLRG